MWLPAFQENLINSLIEILIKKKVEDQVYRRILIMSMDRYIDGLGPLRTLSVKTSSALTVAFSNPVSMTKTATTTTV